MSFRPLADRVLIRPVSPPTKTESGLHLAEQWKPEQLGTVVAVGKGKHPFKEEAFSLAEKVERAKALMDEEFIEDATEVLSDAAQMLRDLTGKEPEVRVGDTVIFSWSAGHELHLNHGEDRLLLMREGDILAVWNPA